MPDDPRASESGLLLKHQEFIKTFFRRGAEFAEELLRENEKLRFRLLELESKARTDELSGRAPAEALRELLSRIEALEKERETLQTRYLSVEAENSNW